MRWSSSKPTISGSGIRWQVAKGITPVTRLNNLAQRYDGGCEYPEVIITNYDPKERENDMFQMNLFDLCFGGEDEDDCD